MECCGNLDQSLQECFFRRRGVQPDFFPRFVSFKEVARVEKGNAVCEQFRFAVTRWGGVRVKMCAGGLNALFFRSFTRRM